MIKLTLEEQEKVLGGISREKYCALLEQIISDNWDSWDNENKSAAANAYAKNC